MEIWEFGDWGFGGGVWRVWVDLRPRLTGTTSRVRPGVGLMVLIFGVSVLGSGLKF